VHRHGDAEAVERDRLGRLALAADDLVEVRDRA